MARKPARVSAAQLDFAPVKSPTVTASPWQQAVLSHRALPSGERRPHGAALARAGSGKTWIIVQLLRQLDPRLRVLGLAFNTAIAEELGGKAPPHAVIQTLHGYGLGRVRAAWGGAAIDPRRDRRLLEEHLPRGLTTEDRAVARRLLSLAKAEGVTLPSEVERVAQRNRLYIPWETRNAELGTRHTDQHLARWVTATIDAGLASPGTICYDDMCYLPGRLRLEEHAWDVVVVDEAQDLSPCQRILVRGALAPGGYLLAVGDPQQSLYAFRGADPRSFERLVADFDADVLPLPVTYRCATSIVEYIQPLVPDFVAVDGAPRGEVSHLTMEAFYRQVRPGEMVVARTNAILTRLCLELLRRGMPAFIQGRDFGADLKRLVSAAEKSAAPEDRKPPALPIAGFVRWLSDYASAEGVRLGAIGEVEQAEELSDRLITLEAMSEGLRTTLELRHRLDAVFDPAGPRVRLSTAHRAKGLESDCVYVVDSFDPTRGEQEKNALYVALSRARTRLHLLPAP